MSEKALSRAEPIFMRLFEVKGSGLSKWKMFPESLRSLKTIEILICLPSSIVWLAQ